MKLTEDTLNKLITTFPYQDPLPVTLLSVLLFHILPLSVCWYLLGWTTVFPWYLAIIIKIPLWLGIIYLSLHTLPALYFKSIARIRGLSIALGTDDIIIEESISTQWVIPYKHITNLTILYEDNGEGIDGIEIEHTTPAPSPLLIDSCRLSLEALVKIWTALNICALNKKVKSPCQTNIQL